MLLSCLGLLECSVLTWPPAGEVPVTCLRGVYSPSQGGGQNTPGHWDCLRVNCGHVFANTVSIYSDLTNDSQTIISVIGNETETAEFLVATCTHNTVTPHFFPFSQWLTEFGVVTR